MDGPSQFKRVDHIGVVVDNYDDASRLLTALGMRQEDEFTNDRLRLRAGFYRCGDVQLEIIEYHDQADREKRLAGASARIEHIAIEVDDMTQAVGALEALGVRLRDPGVFRRRGADMCFTDPESSDGVIYQFLEKNPLGGPG